MAHSATLLAIRPSDEREPVGALLAERGLTTLNADEGGYGPPLPDHGAALALVDAAVQRAGDRPGDDVAYALDVAATHLRGRSSPVIRFRIHFRFVHNCGLPPNARRLSAGCMIGFPLASEAAERSSRL
ncbi:hypothetical protein [Capillimicrobium parvum]|uniref:Enolase n=1 Tax=Capillimicrobium parvum TaxID=2884022 RepID=A0A9E6XY28_9ACTN|nr:hypothetical protein [Capillimicrobium parvum]UGS36453.1 Enolase [Capillimicrobium parvum]